MPKRYTVECLYSRHGKGSNYARERVAMSSTLYEFCFIHYKSINAAQVEINMTEMKADVVKSTELQGIRRSTSLTYMENRRKEANDVYSDMLGSHSVMFMKQAEDLAKLGQRQQKRIDSKSNVQVARSSKDALRKPRMPVHGIHSQEDDSCIVQLQDAMLSLLAVFLETDTNETKATNRWPVRTLNALATHEAVLLNDVKDMCTDTLFCNKSARIAYETFIAVKP